MKKKVYIFILSCLLLVLVNACSKGGSAAIDDGSNNGGGGTNNIVDTTAPGIMISNPSENQVFNSGHTISITGTLTDDVGLYRGSIRVFNDATGAILKEQLYEIHYILLYNYSITYTPMVSAVTTLRIVVSFEDHGGNITTKTVKVIVNP